MTAVRRPTLPVLPPAAAVAQMMNFHGYLILDAFVAFLDGKKKEMLMNGFACYPPRYVKAKVYTAPLT